MCLAGSFCKTKSANYFVYGSGCHSLAGCELYTIAHSLQYVKALSFANGCAEKLSNPQGNLKLGEQQGSQRNSAAAAKLAPSSWTDARNLRTQHAGQKLNLQRLQQGQMQPPRACNCTTRERQRVLATYTFPTHAHTRSPAAQRLLVSCNGVYQA
jgi:hypothetical protein